MAADQLKIADGAALSPTLLMRGKLAAGTALEVADGYHRRCASYRADENTEIPCPLTRLSAPS
ncbi:hypothetical protein [Rhodococcus jostii]|uniref:hypothetical protein n=1 Tax=Rhodococcus jostii TaxID=132919 RepID=UPI000A42E35C|nr:hypothetical protein [Rhodococcus jostii]